MLWENSQDMNAWLNQAKSEGLAYLGEGERLGQAYLNQAGREFLPLGALADKYGGATTMLLNAQGVNGPQGVQAAQNAFQTGPGYQFAMGQGMEELARKRSAGNMYNSGNADQDTIKYAQGMANQEYGNWLKNFQNFINPELQAMSGMTGGRAAALGQQANLADQSQTNMANLTQSDAVNRINVGNMTMQGLTQNAQQGANSQMQASSNALSGIGSLLSLGTSLLGGKKLF